MTDVIIVLTAHFNERSSMCKGGVIAGPASQHSLAVFIPFFIFCIDWSRIQKITEVVLKCVVFLYNSSAVCLLCEQADYCASKARR